MESSFMQRITRRLIFQRYQSIRCSNGLQDKTKRKGKIENDEVRRRKVQTEYAEVGTIEDQDRIITPDAWRQMMDEYNRSIMIANLEL